MFVRSLARSLLFSRNMSTQSAPKAAKLWGGRFDGSTDPLMEKFNNSINFDKRLWSVDIEGSIQYAKAMARAGILTEQEANKIAEGLKKVYAEWENGTFEIVESDEDIHTANERRLGFYIGELAGKLHTGRSRNDQVVTDVRLWLRDEIHTIQTQLKDLQHVLSSLINERKYQEVLGGLGREKVNLGGLTSDLLAVVNRDAARLIEIERRVNMLPLGSGAIAGHAFNLDRKELAKALNFYGPTGNSMDSVSDRDFIIEFMSWSVGISVSLNRFTSDLKQIIVSNPSVFKNTESFTTLFDDIDTINSRLGSLAGGMNILIVAIKGLPTTYNKDLQEDKEPLFNSVDLMKGLLPAASNLLKSLV